MSVNNPEHFFSVPQDSTTPEGWEMVHRSGIVRLGPDYHLHYPDHHAALGIVDVVSQDNLLIVHTDFAEDEVILTATANVDLTLAKKGVFVGASGGTQNTSFAIYSSKKLYKLNGASDSGYDAYTLLAPHSSVFNSGQDNLWINFKSLRPVR